jgi:hypothetical protein
VHASDLGSSTPEDGHYGRNVLSCVYTKLRVDGQNKNETKILTLSLDSCKRCYSTWGKRNTNHPFSLGVRWHGGTICDK